MFGVTVCEVPQKLQTAKYTISYAVQVYPVLYNAALSKNNIQMRAPKTAAYYISPIEIGVI